ncbi:hypothetical protein RYX36_037091 [Vicia faba]
MADTEKQPHHPHIELKVNHHHNHHHHLSISKNESNLKNQSSLSIILTEIHAGYFRISLSLSIQSLLWKILIEPIKDAHFLRHIFTLIPSTALTFLWSLALFTLLTLSFLYLLKCLLHFDKVKDEFSNQIGVNYMFAPWISWLLLLESSPIVPPATLHYKILWLVFVAPIVILDVKIYGQWFTKGNMFLSMVANPTSQMSVVGNLVAAQAAAEMGWKESSICFFSLGIVHYLVLFVTLYQRLPGNNKIPAMLRPVFFLFFAAPSMASLAWHSVCGYFDTASKMLFFLSLFLFLSLVSRPLLFKKSMKKFSVAWWAYSFPLTALAIASTQYAHEVKGIMAHVIMLVLSLISVLVCLMLMIASALNIRVPVKAHKHISKETNNIAAI